MKTYQKVLAIVAIALMFVLLSACGESAPVQGTDVPTVAPTDQPTQAPTSAPTAQPTQDVQPVSAPTTRQQVAAWDGTYGYIFQTITSDMTSIGTDGTNQDLVGMNTDCTQLQTDVATAQGFPAIPDAQTASDFGSGITYLASAAQDCVDGTTGSGDASLLQRAASELDQATAKFTAATADISALTS